MLGDSEQDSGGDNFEKDVMGASGKGIILTGKLSRRLQIPAGMAGLR